MKIYMIGDSTMKFNNYNRYPQCGRGQVLHLFAKNDCLIEDHAENGRSSKSFKDEGRFDVILAKLLPGDFVICAFGHNDEKIQDPLRYTTPYDTYQKHLKYYADKTKEKGAHIVFATPIARHKFVDGVCINTHQDYPQAMLDFCKDNNYTCIDLNTLTINHYNKIGEEESKKYHMIFPKDTYKNYPDGKDDHSHLVYNGALMVAEKFVLEILKSNDPIKNCFIDINIEEEIDWAMLKD